MIEDSSEIAQNIPATETVKENFLEKLLWKENAKGKWILGKRECLNVEGSEIEETDIITFDMAGYDEENTDKIAEGQFVLSEMGKLKVNKIEEGQAFLQLEEGEPIPVPLETVRKFINVNIVLLGKSKNHLLENFSIDINSSPQTFKSNLSERINIREEDINIYHNEKKLECEYFHLSEIKDGDTLLVGFEQPEFVYKRSTSRDYSWYDQKNLIPFIVDKSIIVSAFGFFKHTDTMPSIYDLFLYEITESDDKILVLSLQNVKIMPSECDSDMYVKKVSFKPIILKANVKYYAYVNYKISDQRTYHCYYGTADQTIGGVRFRILDAYQEGYKSDTTRGHLPYIVFRNYNPLFE
jgi:hypothetical protein